MAGEELLQYLIVPGKRSPSSSSSAVPDTSLTSTSTSLSQENHRGKHKKPIASGTPGETTTTAKRRKMEVDTSTMSNPLAGQILSIEEFMAQRRPSAPAPAILSSQLAQLAPQPRMLTARSSKYTIELHEKYQALGIPRPHFEFTGDGAEGWRAHTEFLGRELRVEDGCGTKQEAKERLSELCLGVLKELEAAGQLVKTAKTKKQQTDTVEPEVVRMDKEPGVNHVGRLLEFQRSTSSPQPTYTDFQLGQSFSCEVTLENHPVPFGSRTTFFPSKRAARHHAAGCAVQHFQAQGSWPDSATPLGGIRKKKASVSGPVPVPAPAPTPSSPSSNPVDATATATATDSATGAASFAQRVAHLATQLSLSTPEWRFTPSTSSAPGFHTVACFFRNGGPHAGPLGEVRHVFGKKRAKEECAREVLRYLSGVKETRLEYARGVVRGMLGEKAGVVGVGVGRGVEGEGEARGQGQGGTQVSPEPEPGSDLQMESASDDEGFQSAKEEAC